ncbi:hypothetical protein Tsubulata_049659 [Turnera subulata]|uniref:F-box domain-containing protein n=1 Tax=Turnera subulata TaxID=218843 RepID=A0A9Q0JBB3_9ROSI|nr:hypothetical protein Tsubulata_049659 [Turnera subulata]
MSCSIGGKRQKTGSLRALESSSSPPEPELNLDDSLLAEILRRLPGPRFLFQCACVCKQWYSVISSPYFARLFINNNIALLDEDHEEEENNVLVSYKKNPFSVIASYATHPLFGNPNRKTCNVLLGSGRDDPLFQTLDLRFDYLPVKKQRVHVLATFNDLVLCCSGRNRRFLVNPFTRKWVALPPVPKKGNCSRVSCGLVGEPHCVKDSKGDYTFNSQFKYRVLLIADALHARTPSVRMYCSETGRWRGSVLKVENDLRVYVVHSNVIAYKGKLLWYNGRHIIDYDPFIISKTRYIKAPSNCPTPSDNGHLVKYSIGVCRGFLRLVVWECIATFHHVDVTEWELEDYRLGIWKEVHKRRLPDFIKCHRHWTLPVLSGHPSDPNVVYHIGDDFNIISCQWHTTDFEVAAEMSPKLTAHPSLDLETFPFVLPLWPTPVPVPPQHS